MIRSAKEAGAEQFYVIIGYQGGRVRDFLESLADRLAVSITPLVNDEWDKENGLSVFRAREELHEPFLLLMADHLFDPNLARQLITLTLSDSDIALGVDKNIHNPLIDMEDVTRVKMEDGDTTESSKITDIGKGLTDFNGLDTGIFLCSAAIFKAVERSREQDGDTTLSGAVRILGAEGCARAIPIDGFWIDVDDSDAFQKAEQALLEQLRDKPTDGPVSRYLNRPLSIRISRHLVQRNITPNQISVFSFLCSLLAAGLFAAGNYPALFLGGVLAQFASVIDGCDREVARLKYQSSDLGLPYTHKY